MLLYTTIILVSLWSKLHSDGSKRCSTLTCTASIVEYNVSIANLYPWREGIAELGFNQPVLHIQSVRIVVLDEKGALTGERRVRNGRTVGSPLHHREKDTKRLASGGSRG